MKYVTLAAFLLASSCAPSYASRGNYAHHAVHSHGQSVAGALGGPNPLSGIASVFCDRVTATGGMNCGALVAAHRTWALGSYHQVSHNGRTITVRIVDRGPAAWTHRVIDLSPGAARALGINGLGHVDMS